MTIADETADEYSLFLYRTKEVSEVPGLNDALSALHQYGYELRNEQAEAVVGDLAGEALRIILSPPVQAGAILIVYAQAVAAAVGAVAAAGKRIKLGRQPAKLLGVSTALETDAELSEGSDLKTFGPFYVEPTGDLASCLQKTWDVATIPLGYFLGIASSKGKSFVVRWLILSPSGVVCASWQTKHGTLPDGFRSP